MIQNWTVQLTSLVKENSMGETTENRNRRLSYCLCGNGHVSVNNKLLVSLMYLSTKNVP